MLADAKKVKFLRARDCSFKLRGDYAALLQKICATRCKQVCAVRGPLSEHTDVLLESQRRYELSLEFSLEGARERCAGCMTLARSFSRNLSWAWISLSS